MTRMRSERLARRRGTALILVMLVLLMLTGMTLLLLGGSHTSHLQAREQVAQAQAKFMADAAVRRGILELRASNAPTTTTPVVETNLPFGGGASTGELDYRLSVAQEPNASLPQDSSNPRVYLIEGEGRVRTGAPGSASEWTRAGLQWWVEELVSTTPGTPPAGATPAAITVLSKEDLPPLSVSRTGNHAKISGDDHSLNGAALGPGGSAIAVTAEATTSWTAPAGALEASGGNAASTDQLEYSTMQQWIDSLRATSAATTPTASGDDTYSVGSQGSAAAPVVRKYELSGDGKVTINGSDDFYGILVVKLKSDWTGGTAMNFSGTPEFKGIIYIEVESLGDGTAATSGQPLINLNGGGSVTNQAGAILIDVKSPGEGGTTFTGASKKIAHMNGGGNPAQRKFAFSTAGVNLAKTVLETPPTNSTTTLSLVGHRTVGGLGITEAP